MSKLEERARDYGIRLQPEQIAQIETLVALLGEWSSRMNLVADADPNVVMERHVLESIALGAALRERELLRPGLAVLDVGSGGGFPGLILKVIWPSLDVTLIEATGKKAGFLREAAARMGLENVDILTGRAEDLGHDSKLRERFDLVTARAVAPLRTLLELTLPFARVGGRVITPKGSRAEDEVVEAANALQVLGGQAFSMPLAVPGPAQTIIAVLKRAPTPDAYPRRSGRPARNPL